METTPGSDRREGTATGGEAGPDGGAGSAPRRVALFGATGTIGRATAAALQRQGHAVTCFVRPGRPTAAALPPDLALCPVDPADGPALAAALGAAGCKAVISCMASRTGAPRDAWAVDYLAHHNLLAAAGEAGVQQFVLLSAICVQKPLLAFQQAKLAFERELVASGLRYSIVRPTAFFKSLSGQIDRVRRGQPFLIFGDGRLTACTPISDEDLAAYLVGCLDDPARWNRVLPIGGPGPAITPREQGEALFALLGRPPRFRSVPVGLLDAIITVLATLGRVVPALAAKAELARIGRYYATESMLVLDPRTGRYDAAATPATGTATLVDFYRAVMAGEAAPERGDHAVF
ncbi:NAD(P)H-binding protein [Novosphingobium piscinae]|uniref:Divinyl chlorophyllide a 8-vinyl-reductase, chloroplastic n=1 Tax=Novosphingobium piscinae TaxID=1507448 RepID=A0A7X1FXV5_9SPHN|nr:NAD(P)H-binding protein [Novosphingobium piscinae]MBC2669020.1 NAD(P)H-binding protein [Novosphingobium piscinae]